jgi:hypothetical protein
MKMADSRASSFSSDSHKEHGHNHHHRLSFPGMHFGRSNKETQHTSPATLDWKLESPPLVMYGDPATSSGTLLSGQLFLNIKEDGLEIESLDATLSIHVTQKKPFANHCAECTNQYTELKRWELLQHPLAMAKGRARLFSFCLSWRSAANNGMQANTRFHFRCCWKGTSRQALTAHWCRFRMSSRPRLFPEARTAR